MFLYEGSQLLFSIREEERGIIYFREYRRVEDLVSREIDIVMEIGAGKEMDGVFPDGFNIVFKGKDGLHPCSFLPRRCSPPSSLPLLQPCSIASAPL